MVAKKTGYLLEQEKRERLGRQRLPEGPLISYEYLDILSQRAYRAMYGGNDHAGNYFILGFVFNSHTKLTTSTVGSPGVVIDKDFDLEFKSSQVIEGLCIITFTTGNVGDTNNIPKIYIRKYTREGVEIELVSYTTGAGALGTAEYCFSLIMPQTKFKKGDKLRVTMEITSTGLSGTGARFWHDPTGATDPGSGEDSEFRIWTPFKQIL